MNAEVEKINPRNVEEILPLSPMQESMLYSYLKDPGSQMYFEQTSYEITGDGGVDAGKLKEAWNITAANNEMLRTVFRWRGLKKPVQVILKKHTIPIKEIDLFLLSNEDRQDQLDLVKKNDRQNKVNLNNGPLRVILCKMSENRYEMIVSNHHIIYDGWSNIILLKELAEAYNNIYSGILPGKLNKIKYKDYIKWQQRQGKNQQAQYWRTFLKGYTGCASFSQQKKVSGPGESGEKRSEYLLTGDMQKKIHDFSRREGVTLAMLFYAAWAILLHKYTNMKNIVFGITVSGRDARLKGIQDMIGLFINTIPLRLNINPEDEIAAFLTGIKEILRAMEAYENTPLTRIMAFSELGHKDSLFDSVVVIQNYPMHETWFKEGSRLKIALTTRFYMTKISLALGVRTFEQIILDFSYNTGI
ncbi:MAG: condensation domain-containing protein, partial [Acidobacteria bacterium]|nr:condensation domain-containing protein [Acidobacteriota bacterium]